jgi:hypothetical protein
MNTRTAGLVALSFVLATGICRANLGETENQCIARYGSEFNLQDNLGFDVVGDKAASFQVKTAKGSFLIKVIFLNGLDVHETLSNADTSRGFSEEQMKALIDSESAGMEWRKRNTVYRTDRSDATSETEDWLRSDGATARFWMSGKAATNESGEVDLSTRDYAEAQRILDKQNGAN